jgi:hypothetical protein
MTAMSDRQAVGTDNGHFLTAPRKKTLPFYLTTQLHRDTLLVHNKQRGLHAVHSCSLSSCDFSFVDYW